MRLHTSLNQASLYRAAELAGVQFERLNEHGSRSHPAAFDLLLSGSSGRRGNFGGDYYAATWDEWGIFLGHVFRADPAAKCAYYLNAEDYRWQTGARFDTLTLSEQHRAHKWGYQGQSMTGTYSVHTCPCGALKRYASVATRIDVIGV